MGVGGAHIVLRPDPAGAVCSSFRFRARAEAAWIGWLGNRHFDEPVTPAFWSINENSNQLPFSALPRRLVAVAGQPRQWNGA